MRQPFFRQLSLCLLLAIGVAMKAQTQYAVEQNSQHHFAKTVPAGNYSGITWLGGNRYAVVSDKSQDDGFFTFEINVDSLSGEITSARSLGFHSSGFPNRDDEGIAYNPSTRTLFISGESDNYIYEYSLDGMRTGRSIAPTPLFSKLPGNLGLEALSYDSISGRLWTCNESGDIHIQTYDSLLRPLQTYDYELDAPIADRSRAQFYAHGIGTLCALNDSSLLILEREFYVPRKKIGSFVNCKLYLFSPGKEGKQLLSSWKTRLTIFDRSIANYEGMCLGPRLADGSRCIILVADSQNQYAGVLKDWLKSLKLRLVKAEP